MEKLAGRPSDALAAKDLTRTLLQALEPLPDREQAILQQRFGMDGDDEHTLRAIGESLGVSRERIRPLEARALDKLRRLGTIQALEPYLRE